MGIQSAALLFCPYALSFQSIYQSCNNLSILQPVENIFKIYSLLSQRKIASTYLKLSLKTLSSTAFLDTVGHICRCQSSPTCCLFINQIPHTPCHYASICHKHTEAHPLAFADCSVKCRAEIIVEGILQSVKVMESE